MATHRSNGANDSAKGWLFFILAAITGVPGIGLLLAGSFLLCLPFLVVFGLLIKFQWPVIVSVFRSEDDEDSDDEEDEDDRPEGDTTAKQPARDLDYGKTMALKANRFGSSATQLAEAWSAVGEDPEAFISIFNGLDEPAKHAVLDFLHATLLGRLDTRSLSLDDRSDQLSAPTNSDYTTVEPAYPDPATGTVNRLPGTVRSTVAFPTDTGTFTVKGHKPGLGNSDTASDC